MKNIGYKFLSIALAISLPAAAQYRPKIFDVNELNCGSFLGKQNFQEIFLSDSEFNRLSGKIELNKSAKSSLLKEVRRSQRKQADQQFISPVPVADYKQTKRIVVARPYTVPIYRGFGLSHELKIATLKDNGSIQVWEDALLFDFDQRIGDFHWRELAGNGQDWIALSGYRDLNLLNQAKQKLGAKIATGHIVRVHNLMGELIREFSIQPPSAVDANNNPLFDLESASFSRSRGLIFNGSDVYYLASFHSRLRKLKRTPLILYKMNVESGNVEMSYFEVPARKIKVAATEWQVHGDSGMQFLKEIPGKFKYIDEDIFRVSAFVVKDGNLILKGIAKMPNQEDYKTVYFSGPLNFGQPIYGLE